MPASLINHIDPAALIALGFLGAVLILTLALFGWVITRRGNRKRDPS